jgi:ADP-ribose pyrophosphatase
MDLKETFVGRNYSVRGSAVGFNIDTVRLPDGKLAKREYLDHPGAVAVVPLLGPKKVVLVQQYRHPVGQITWEIPAGKLQPGEDPLACVKRELVEETGYSAGKIKKIVSFWPTPAFANEVIHVFKAENLRAGQMNPDDDEFIGCAVWPLAKVYRAISSGAIRDSKTIIALFALKAMARR